MNKKVAIMVDSECGYTEIEARERGLNFVPIIMIIDGKEGYSGIDYPVSWFYNNLTKDTIFKTAASKFGDVQEEYRKALKTADHVLFIPLSKNLSSQVEYAKLAADDDEFKDRVTVYDSEYIGPWLIYNVDYFMELMKKNSPLEEYLKFLDLQKGNMIGWLYPVDLDRMYASGRLSKAQYMAGNLLKIIPIIPIVNGEVTKNGIIKKRTIKKALHCIVDEVIKENNKLKSKGKLVDIITVTLGKPNEDIIILEKMINDKGYSVGNRLWAPGAIVGHVGVGGVGAGVFIKPYKDYVSTQKITKDKS